MTDSESNDQSFELLKEALDGVDLEQLGEGVADQYPSIPGDKIIDADGYYPLKGLLMRMANENLRDARAQAEGEIIRQPEDHEAGWSIAIETPNGIVGVWSCWLRNRFYLGFPKVQEKFVPNQLVMEVLGVKQARPILQVDAVAVNNWEYKGEFADPDKPLVENQHGQIIGYSTRGLKKWAKFYSEPVESGGRVWVDYSDFESNGMQFPTLNDKGEIENIYYGHEFSNSISTFQFDFFNEYAPDGPITRPEAIQEYKEKFILLACEIAEKMGGAKKLHIDYGFAMVPEDLDKEGYDTKWQKGEPGARKGLGNELVIGAKNNELVALRSGNSLVPWSTIRRIEIPQSTSTPYRLAQFIIEDGLYF